MPTTEGQQFTDEEMDRGADAIFAATGMVLNGAMVAGILTLLADLRTRLVADIRRREGVYRIVEHDPKESADTRLEAYFHGNLMKVLADEADAVPLLAPEGRPS